MAAKNIVFAGIGLIGVLLICASLFGLFYGIFHPGSWLLLLIGLLVAVVGFGGQKIAVLLHRPALAGVFLAGVMVLLLFLSIFFIALGLGGRRRLPPANTPVTVIVLGSKVISGRPSLMLARRLQQAADYLAENPNARCIVTGGQGVGETETEALVMKRYLIELGVYADRIWTEDQSTDTYQNLAFSRKIIEENNLSREIVIATDGFHQMRSAFYASHLDFGAIYALPASTPWGLLPGYATREILSMIKAVFLNK